MTIDEIRKILPTLPESPGCYKYIGQEGTVIYVGKAKNLHLALEVAADASA